MKIQGAQTQVLAHYVDPQVRQEQAQAQNERQAEREQARNNQQISATNTNVQQQQQRQRGLFLNAFPNEQAHSHQGGQALQRYQSVADNGNVELMNRIDEMV